MTYALHGTYGELALISRFENYAEIFFLPFARLLARTFLPLAVDIR